MSDFFLAARKRVRAFRSGRSARLITPGWCILAAVLLAFGQSLATAQPVYVDVGVYGGTSGGVIAAVKAARMGKTVALVCDKNHLGGITSSGLGWTDWG